MRRCVFMLLLALTYACKISCQRVVVGVWVCGAVFFGEKGALVWVCLGLCVLNVSACMRAFVSVGLLGGDWVCVSIFVFL